MIESQIFPVNIHVQTLGWVLLNFIWQGLLLAALLKGLLSGMQWCSATLRYNVAVAVLLAILAIPVTSFLKPHLMPPDTRSVKEQTDVMPYLVQVSPGIRQENSIDNINGMKNPTVNWTELRVFVQHLLPWVSAFWLTGFLVAFIRTLVGLIKALQLKRGAKEFTGELDFPGLTRKLGVRSQVKLLETSRVNVPSVIGCFRPVILFPEGSSFAPEQALALVAHELAHVRRQDHLVNLFQVIIEALLFFHPAVWWVSSQVRIERESCCDDAAISVCGNAKTYVRSLTEAERYRSVSKWAVAASGASLLNRIRRIIDMEKKSSNRFVSWSAMVLGVTLILVVASGSSLLAFIPESSPASVESTVQANPEVDSIFIESMIVEIAPSELDKFGAIGGTKTYSPKELAELRNKIQSGRIKAKILSNPKLLTLNKKESRISVGGKVHYMEKAGDGLFRPRAFETPIGMQLSITPTILENRIGMDINLQVTDISERLAVTEYPDLNIGKPTVRIREHTAIAVLKDGDTVAISGMKNVNSEEDNEMIAFITASIADR